jgi:hypothetical protein
MDRGPCRILVLNLVGINIISSEFAAVGATTFATAIIFQGSMIISSFLPLLIIPMMIRRSLLVKAWSSRPYFVRSAIHQAAPTMNRLSSILVTATRQVSSQPDFDETEFRSGNEILVEILSFGPLGASVDVVARSHDEKDIIARDAPILASGLILQKEIQYFRQGRGNIDVVRGEILPAYVERVRDNLKVDVSLRPFGGQAKADLVSHLVMDQLRQSTSGSLPIGDKSDPQDIQDMFPGASKKNFKRALSSLYKRGLVQLDDFSVCLSDKSRTIDN